MEVRTERGRMEGRRVSGCRKERGMVEGEVGDCGIVEKKSRKLSLLFF